MLAPDDLYLDHNATSPLRREVRECLEDAMAAGWANPASTHPAGQRARDRLERARRQLADLLGCDPSQVTFTSGGTESNHLAILGQLPVGRSGHLVVSAIEHPSVLETAELAGSLGHAVTLVPPDPDGRVPVDALLGAVREETSLVCLMSANNETGVCQPVAEVGEALGQRGVAFHVDAIQSLGREEVAWRKWRCSTFSLSGHKVGAPPGIGALVVAPGVALRPWMRGGTQERGRRGGTPNFLGALGLGAAAEALARSPRPGPEARDHFEALLRERRPDLRWNGLGGRRLSNTSHLTMPGIPASVVLAALGRRGVHAAAGSACRAGADEPSHVLKAMGLTLAERRSSLRVSFGPEDGAGAGERAALALLEVLGSL